MRLRWLVSICVAGAVALFVACGNGATNQQATIRVNDDAGRTVELERPAQKIVSLAPSNTELVYALGAGDKLVGADDYSDFPVEAKRLEKVGGYAKTNIEKVVSLAPDLVLATNIHAKAIAPELESRGFRVVIVQPSNVEAVLDSIKMVGKLTDKTREGDKLIGDLQLRLDAVAQRVNTAKARPRVYFELGAGLFTVGPGTFVHDMIARAGGQNVAADATTQWPQLNQEALIVKDPEVIILSDYGQSDAIDQVMARPGWQVISAVKGKRIAKMNADLLNRPGPRVLDGLEEMARLLQPELFR